MRSWDSEDQSHYLYLRRAKQLLRKFRERNVDFFFGASPFLPRYAMHKRGLCRHAVSDQLTIQSTSVASRESVRDLGVYLDSDVSMNKHVTQLACSCYGVLRQLRSIRRSLPRTALTTFSSFIMSKVDYCNVVLARLPQRELDRVQSVVNVAACPPVSRGSQVRPRNTIGVNLTSSK